MSEGPDRHERRPRGEEPSGRQQHDEAGDATFADVFNGFTFGSRRGRRKRRQSGDEEPPPESEAPQTSGWQPPESSPPQAPPPQAPPSRIPPQGVPGPGGGPDVPGERRDPVEPDDADIPAASVRSYAWTGGRTKSNVELELETLVTTSEYYQPAAPLRLEHQSIAQLCRHPRSVAEIGALLGVPLGVTRVLLADMAELGLINVHQTVTDSGSQPHMQLMERVLSGLRRL